MCTLPWGAGGTRTLAYLWLWLPVVEAGMPGLPEQPEEKAKVTLVITIAGGTT